MNDFEFGQEHEETCSVCGALIVNGDRVGTCMADDPSTCDYAGTDFKMNPFQELDFNE